MPTKYQVFCDNLSGMTCCPSLGADTLEDAVQNIQEGTSSQHWMYYIYVLYQERVPYWGRKVDVYKHVKALGGSFVTPMAVRHREGLLYTLTTWEEGWLFADVLF